MVVLAVVIAAGLAGCSAPHDVQPASQTESPLPIESAEPSAQSLAAGATVNPDVAAIINATSEDTGKYAYRLSDGTYVLTDTTADLPEIVTQDIKVTTAPVAAPIASIPPQDSGTAFIALQDFLEQKESEIGRKIIIVLQAKAQGDGFLWGTLSGGGSTGIHAGAYESTFASADAWAQKNAALLIVMN